MFSKPSGGSEQSPLSVQLAGLSPIFPSAPATDAEGNLYATRGETHYLLARSQPGTLAIPSAVRLQGALRALGRDTPEGPKLYPNFFAYDGQVGRFNRLLSDKNEEVLFRQVGLGALTVSMLVWGPAGRLYGAVPFLASLAPSGTKLQGLFRAAFSIPSRTVMLETDGKRFAAHVGSSPWFEPRNPVERRLLDFHAGPFLETDSLERLGEVVSPLYAPLHDLVLYQHWNKPESGGRRRYRTFDAEAGREMAQILRASPVRHLILLVTGFAEGGVSALVEGLRDHPLETLGLFFCFGGDDFTDTPFLAEEIAAAARALPLRRLVLFSAAFDQASEERLARSLHGSRDLSVSVFLRDVGRTFPKLETPILAGALG